MKRVKKFLLLTIFLSFLLLIPLQTFIDNDNMLKGESDFIGAKENLQPIANSYSNVNESFSSVYQVSNLSSAGDIGDAKVAVDSKKNVHIVWADSTYGDSDILYRNFTYSTQKWGDILNISLTSTESTTPDIEVDSSDTIHITWTEDSGDIKYRFIESPNFQISSVKDIASDGTNVYLSPVIATNGTNTITICWYIDTFGGISACYYDYQNELILYTENITAYDSRTYNPQIVYSNDAVLHLVCRYTDVSPNLIQYTNRSDSGWDVLHDLTDGLALYSLPEDPDISFDKKNSKIHTCWKIKFSASSYNEIVVKSKDLNGDFPDSPTYTISASENLGSPKIEVDGNGLIYVVYKQGTNFIYSTRLNDDKELKVSTSDTYVKYTPHLTSDINGSIHFVYEDREGGSSIKYRIYDTFLPQLNVTFPLNDTALSGIVTLQTTVDFDTDKVEFYYNDSGSWEYIGETNQSEGWEFDWDTNKTGNVLNFRNIIINATAYDVNGLDETVLIGGIVIDNIDPQISRIAQIYDDSTAYDRNSIKGTRNFNGTVHIQYEVYDNNSGIDYVSLYNGSTFIMNNNTNDEFVINSDIVPYIYDGNYSDLKIIAFDKAGNLNMSAVFPSEEENIIIDNIDPTVSYLELTNGTEVTGDINLKILTDLDVVNVTFWNYTTSIDSRTQILSSITDDSQGQWETTFDSSAFNGTMSFLAIATDGNNNTGTKILELFVDNIDPDINVTNLKDQDNIGLVDKIITIEVEIDTLIVNMSYKYGIKPYEFITENSTFENVAGKPNRKTTELTFNKSSEVDVDIEEGFFIKIAAIDDVGQLQEVELQLFLVFNTPDPLAKENISYQIKKYDVIFSWKEISNGTYLRIYRSLNPFDIEYLNDIAKDDPNRFHGELGENPGEKYCIANITIEDGVLTFTDTVDGPNKFYYLFAIINQYGYPSEVTPVNIQLSSEDFGRTHLENPTSNWLLYFGVFLGFMGLLDIYGLKRVKKKFFKGKVKITTKKIEKELAASFDTGDFDLDARVHKEESMIISGTPKIKTEKKYTTFEEQEKAEEQATIDKCPTCGWILSSTATKCPRCGWQR